MDGRDGRMGAHSPAERAIGLVLLGLLALGCVVVLAPFLSTILWAVILTLATWPLFRRIERRLNGRTTLAAFLMTLLLAAVLVAPLLVVALSLEEQASKAVQVVRDLVAEGMPPPPAWLADTPAIGPSVYEQWQRLALGEADLATEIGQFMVRARGWLISAGLKLSGDIAYMALAVVIAFFLYRHGDAAARHLRTAARRLDRVRAERLLGVAHRTMIGIVYGVLGTSLAQAILVGIGFAVAGVPGAGILAVLFFFLSLVPLAPLLVLAPAVAWLFYTGSTAAAVLLLVWVLAVSLLADNLLKPYLISRGGSLPVILILLGILGGVAAFGLLGIFLGPTLLALGFTLAQEWSAGDERDALLDSALSPRQ